VVIIFAFLDLGKNISFSDTLIEKKRNEGVKKRRLKRSFSLDGGPFNG